MIPDIDKIREEIAELGVEAGPEIKRALKAFDSVLSPGTKAWAAMQRVRR